MRTCYRIVLIVNCFFVFQKRILQIRAGSGSETYHSATKKTQKYWDPSETSILKYA
jgi:hypothetical protein